VELLMRILKAWSAFMHCMSSGRRMLQLHDEPGLLPCPGFHLPACLQIRFFERVKLERRLNRLQAQLAAAAKGQPAEGEAQAQEQEQVDPAELQRQVAAVQEDLQYVLNFPKGEKYVSLLRQAEDPEAQVGGCCRGACTQGLAGQGRAKKGRAGSCWKGTNVIATVALTGGCHLLMLPACFACLPCATGEGGV
jgi:hypothetical protein